MPAVEILRPQRQTPFGERARLILAKHPELIGEIAGRKDRAIFQPRCDDAPEKEQHKDADESKCKKIIYNFRFLIFDFRLDH